MRNNIYILFFLFLLSSTAIAQRSKFFEKKGKEAFADANYYGASQYFKKALSLDSTNVDLLYLCADASRLNLEYDNAIHYYKLVFKADRGQKYPLTPFWLGSLYKSVGNYKEALRQFERYSKKFKRKNNYYTQKSNQEIVACNFAIQLIKDTTDFEIQHLDSVINSVVAEFAAFEWNDTLYFSSLKPNKEDRKKIGKNKIYFSDLMASQQSTKQLDTIINSIGTHNGNVAFSKDGSQLFFSRCKQLNTSNFECKIYTTTRDKNGKWQAPEELPDAVNQENYSSTHPFVTTFKNEEYLFFSSNRNGSIGGYDIWYIPLNFSSVAANAGKLINSIEDEVSPFYCAPCKQLYFSSQWHLGLGGFDIFKSNYNDTTFSTPQNLGLPFNSSYNDLYFSINKKQTTAYLTSNRLGSFFEKNETCCNDIYKIKLKNETVVEDSIPLVLTDTISHLFTKLDSTLLRINKLREIVPLTLYFHNDEPDSRTTNTTTKKSYNETFLNYISLKPTYKNEYSKTLKGNSRVEALNSIDAFFEDSVEFGFEQLEKFSTYLVETLELGDTVIVTMKGFCSPLASSDYNIKLAKRRVNSLVNYFKTYNSGVLMQYINQTSANKAILILEEESIGELKAPQHVSDNLKDKRNSVYSPDAALERKIQIIAVGFK